MNTSLIDLHWEHSLLGRISGVLSMVQLSDNIIDWSPSDDFWNPCEVDAWNRLKFFKRQRQYMAGRYAGKMAISRWLEGVELKEFSIQPGVFNQPVVRAPYWEIPHVTIAHTDDRGIALAVAAGFSVGIDIEDISPERISSVKSIFLQHFGRPAETCLPAEFAEILEWTAYESLSKALLIGLTFPFENIITDKIEPLGSGFWRWTWRDFTQYQTLVFIVDAHVIAMSYPIQSKLVESDDEFFIKITDGLRNSSLELP